MRQPSEDAVRAFAEELLDDLRIAEIVRERDATRTGEYVTLEEVAAELGIDLDEL